MGSVYVILRSCTLDMVDRCTVQEDHLFVLQEGLDFHRVGDPWSGACMVVHHLAFFIILFGIDQSVFK